MDSSFKYEMMPFYEEGDLVLARAENELPWPAKILRFRGFHQGSSGLDTEIYTVTFFGKGDEEFANLESHLVTPLSSFRIRQLRRSSFYEGSDRRQNLVAQLTRVERLIERERSGLGGRELDKFNRKYDA